MTLKKQLKKLLTGLSIQQEYLCLSLEDIKQSMRVFLTTIKSTSYVEVTKSHLLLGYKPLVVAIVCDQNLTVGELLEKEETICLHFGQLDFEANARWSNFGADKKSTARIILHRIEKKILGTATVYLYEGVHGEHDFISRWHQWVNALYEGVKIQRAGNIKLPGNLYEQVRIAYSIPRTVSIITVSDRDGINMFPTDLHGAVGEEFYIGSLRIGGMANHQVEQLKRIVISEVDAKCYREAYLLGQNHMRGLQGSTKFSLHQQVSDQFRYPLPKDVIRYRELIWRDSVDIGIHRINIYNVVSARMVIASMTTLAHVHHYYVQWRQDRGLKTNYLLR